MVDQTDQQPPESISFDHFEGLKNTVTRERLKPTEFEIAKNVDLDDAGQARRRRGYRKVANGSWHSLYSDASGLVLGVKDDVLGIVHPNWSFDPILPSIGPQYLDYVRVSDTVYFSSLLTSGKFNAVSGQVLPWGQIGGAGDWISPVLLPTPTLGPISGRLLGKVPMATNLAYWNGRIYLACGRLLWATDLWLYDRVDQTRTFFQFEDDITMVDAVTDGLYVGTTSACYFLGYEKQIGGSIKDLKRTLLMSYGVLMRSSVQVPAELIKPQISQDPQSPIKNAVMFLTHTGVIAGFDSGATYNLTQADFLFPLAERASTMFRRQDGINQFVAVMNSGGNPSDSARIGDYVDVEIRRFSGA
jgi:hypothetical protein